ncbi:MAG: hypothetical protein AAF391_13155, partial [Bacteroidota bacterium]
GGENVDKIRDILFGGQMRDYDRRFNELEQRLVKENQRLADEVSSRLDKLDAFIKKEVDRIAERNKQEKKDRLDAEKSLDSSLQKSTKDLLKAIGDVDESLTENCAELRKDLHDQSQEFEKDLNQSKADLEYELDTKSKELHELKVSRDELAGFFNEIALRLNKEFNLPSDD